MSLFGGVLTLQTVTFLMFSIFAVGAVGFAVGRITIKGVSLGAAGVFIIALVYGCLFYPNLAKQFAVQDVTYVNDLLKTVENLGLILFVTSVGFIAGPKFAANFKKNYKSYVLLGPILVLSGAVVAVLCILIGRNFTSLPREELTAIMTGVLSGAMTSTPAFSAAKEAAGAELESLVSVGYGIAYLFGVVGIVLFVQLTPKLAKADMEKERALLTDEKIKRRAMPEGLSQTDRYEFLPFCFAAALGVLLGSFKIGTFSLTTTGGCLLTGLLFGHFGRIGKISLLPKPETLKAMRELGLFFFLIGAGIASGEKFVRYFDPLFFVYGAFITVLPLIVGYFFARKVMKLPLLNALGSITGGRTSTPALGTLIQVAGTEDVANAYAATYPIAMIAIVIVSQLILRWF